MILLGGWPSLSFSLDSNPQTDDTTEVNSPRRESRREGCPTLWVRKGGRRFLVVPKGLKRVYGRGHLHFITCGCDRRRPLLGSVRARDLFLRILGEVRARYRFALVGFVVMPEHFHLLMGEPEVGNPSPGVRETDWELRFRGQLKCL